MDDLALINLKVFGHSGLRVLPAALSINLGAGGTPAFSVARINTSTSLIKRLFPIVNLSLVWLSIRTILGNGLLP